MSGRAIVALAILALLGGCGPRPADGEAQALFVGTTTTTQDTGLMDVLIPDFERRTGYRARLVVAGSGQILQMASRGELDVILTHSPEDEERFVRDGFGVDRRLVMHNEFLLLGPASDPAGVRGSDVLTAFRRIFSVRIPFISRGDRSGTHVRELALWRDAGIDPAGQAWYTESSAGQLQTLQLASQRRAYVFADRGTWLANRHVLDLAVLVEHGVNLLNVYHVTSVNPARLPHVHAGGARAFADYIVFPDAQRLIGEFGRERFGEPLFVPDAGKPEPEVR